MTSDVASGHAGLWTEPKHPGDMVRCLLLKRGSGRDAELGQVCIQYIDDGMVKVCKFLPGEVECSPGDTPKTWPEYYQHARFVAEADALFDRFVQEAYADGWQNYNPESDNG